MVINNTHLTDLSFIVAKLILIFEHLFSVL